MVTLNVFINFLKLLFGAFGVCYYLVKYQEGWEFLKNFVLTLFNSTVWFWLDHLCIISRVKGDCFSCLEGYNCPFEKEITTKELQQQIDSLNNRLLRLEQQPPQEEEEQQPPQEEEQQPPQEEEEQPHNFGSAADNRNQQDNHFDNRISIHLIYKENSLLENFSKIRKFSIRKFF